MSLPRGYKRLEYIQSSGKQYINTGFKPNNNTRVVMDAELVSGTGNIGLFGARVSANSNNYALAWIGSYFRSDYNTVYTQKWKVSQTARRIYDKNKETSTIDGVSQSYTNETFQVPVNLALLANNQNGNITWFASAKLYSCQIYDNGTLVRDFVPCINASGEVGLYDLVGKQFYGNAGTGTFTAGPIIAIAADKSEITKLEYIQSSGTQYINTGFKPNQDTRVTMDFNLLEIVSQYADPIFGVRTSASSKGFYFWSSGYGTTTERYQSGYNNGSTYQQVTRLGRHYVDKNKNITTIDGVSTSATYTAFTTDWNMLLFNSYNNGNLYQNTKLKLYSCKIYDNDVLVRDFIAAKLSDGTVGLYDKLSGLLYINSGTGTFEAGPSSLNLPVNIGGTWKDANEVFVNIGGTWKTVEAAFVNIGGTWKELG